MFHEKPAIDAAAAAGDTLMPSGCSSVFNGDLRCGERKMRPLTDGARWLFEYTWVTAGTEALEFVF